MAEIPPFVQTDAPEFVRDTRNHALLNKDRNALQRHRNMRAKARTGAQRIQSLEQQLAELKQVVQAILERQ